MTIEASKTFKAIASREGEISSITEQNYDLLWWQPLGAGVDGTVFALALDNSSNLFVGGSMDHGGGIASKGLVKCNQPYGPSPLWEGTVNSTWIDSGSVSSLAYKSTYPYGLFVGGDFHVVGYGGFDVYYLAKWDDSETNWLEIDPINYPNAAVNALLAKENGFYAGGTFNSIAGIDHNFIANWTGTTWEALANGLSAEVYSLSFTPNGVNILASQYRGVGNSDDRVMQWSGTTWEALPGGGINNGQVRTLVSSEGLVFAGGSFTNPGSGIAKWDGNSWSEVGGGVSGIIATVMALAADRSGNVFVGGSFNKAGGQDAAFVAKWDGTTWEAIGVGTNGVVRALAFFKDQLTGCDYLYAGGSFSEAGGIPVNNIAKWGKKK